MTAPIRTLPEYGIEAQTKRWAEILGGESHIQSLAHRQATDELARKIVRALEAGAKRKEIAQRLGISLGAFERLRKRGAKRRWRRTTPIESFLEEVGIEHNWQRSWIEFYSGTSNALIARVRRIVKRRKEIFDRQAQVYEASARHLRHAERILARLETK